MRDHRSGPNRCAPGVPRRRRPRRSSSIRAPPGAIRRSAGASGNRARRRLLARAGSCRCRLRATFATRNPWSPRAWSAPRRRHRSTVAAHRRAAHPALHLAAVRNRAPLLPCGVSPGERKPPRRSRRRRACAKNAASSGDLRSAARRRGNAPGRLDQLEERRHQKHCTRRGRRRALDAHDATAIAAIASGRP